MIGIFRVWGIWLTTMNNVQLRLVSNIILDLSLIPLHQSRLNSWNLRRGGQSGEFALQSFLYLALPFFLCILLQVIQSNRTICLRVSDLTLYLTQGVVKKSKVDSHNVYLSKLSPVKDEQIALADS